MIIPSGGCDAMHMAANFEVLRRDLRIAEEHLGLARGERDAMAKRLVEAGRELAEVEAAFDGAKLGMKALNELLVETQAERDALAARVAQLEQEKSVLIYFAKKSCEACEICRHVDIIDIEKCEGICDECALASCCVCAKCYESSEFEFVGVVKSA